jgi:hypothetical protein
MKYVHFCLLVLFSASSAMAAASKATHTFQSQRKPGQTDHVVVGLKVNGETKFVEQGKPKGEKMAVACDFEYDEKTLDVPANPNGLWRSVRNYTKTAAIVHVGGDEFKPTLRPERALIVAETAGQTATLFSPHGPLTSSELETIDIQANSLLIDRLLPEKEVAVGDKWDHSGELLAVVLGLDEVAKTDVQSTLSEVTGKVARFTIKGKVEGAVHGVTSQIELEGKYRFDLRAKRIDWLAVLINENRQSSLVADGVDAKSVLQVTVNRINEPADLSKEALDKLDVKSSPETTQLTYDSTGGGWRLNHDRRWHVFRDQHDLAVLRMCDRGEVISQCNVSSLPERAPDKLVSLEEFQEDIRRALGENFGEFIEASQKNDEANHRVLRVVVEGKAADLPIQWIYYHVADQTGRQVAFAFTTEKRMLERFVDADDLPVHSLRFAEPAAGENSKTARRVDPQQK